MGKIELKEERYRALNFDLKLKLLRKYYPKKNILNAYKDIKSFMIKNDFLHRQWSGYRSNEMLTDWQVAELMLEMRNELPWIDKCSTKIDVTNIERIYDIKRFFDSHDSNEKYRDIEEMFKESEIKEFNSARKSFNSLEERIKSAEKTVKESNPNKSVTINIERKSYIR